MCFQRTSLGPFFFGSVALRPCIGIGIGIVVDAIARQHMGFHANQRLGTAATSKSAGTAAR
jgi:hypothetical protein